MNKALTTALAYLVGSILIAGPVLIAVHLANSQSIAIESRKALKFSDEVMRRTEETSRQMTVATEVMMASQGGASCSKAELALMRKVVISSHLQGVGRVRGNRLVCSSFGEHGMGFELGAPDYISNRGIAIRIAAALPIAPDSRFIITELAGYAAIISRDVILDVQDYTPGLVLGVVSESTHRMLSSRGTFNPAWLRPLAQGASMTFYDGNALVALRRSKTFDIVTLAAVPAKSVERAAYELMWVMVPTGLFLGLSLATGFYYFIRHQVSIPALLRSALRRNEFFMMYQPIVRLDNRQCVGAEALLRWRRQDGTLVRPDLFIPVAEETGLITSITRRILALIEREVPALVSAFPQLHISVNLSSRDLQSANIVKQLSVLMRRSGIAPGNLIVEATERGLIDVELATAIVHEIRETGIGVAIDDFGTGYSCLSYLTTLNVDYLKIDKSFVDTIGTTAPTNSVVLHIIEMAKSLNLEMIAEGVENETQAQFLRERGVQFGQGWHFARPMLSEDLMRYMKAETAARHLPHAACGS